MVNLTSENPLMTPSFGLTSHKLAHFFCLFSFLGECHPDRGIEWSGLLPHKHAVLLLPSTTHLPCILQQFWITTITCVHMFSECYIFAFCVDYSCSNGCHYVLAVGSVGCILFCASGTYDSHDTLPVTTWKSFCCAKVRPISLCIRLRCLQCLLVHTSL